MGKGFKVQVAKFTKALAAELVWQAKAVAVTCLLTSFVASVATALGVALTVKDMMFLGLIMGAYVWTEVHVVERNAKP